MDKLEKLSYLYLKNKELDSSILEIDCNNSLNKIGELDIRDKVNKLQEPFRESLVNNIETFNDYKCEGPFSCDLNILEREIDTIFQKYVLYPSGKTLFDLSNIKQLNILDDKNILVGSNEIELVFCVNKHIKIMNDIIDCKYDINIAQRMFCNNKYIKTMKDINGYTYDINMAQNIKEYLFIVLVINIYIKMIVNALMFSIINVLLRNHGNDIVMNYIIMKGKINGTVVLINWDIIANQKQFIISVKFELNKVINNDNTNVILPNESGQNEQFVSESCKSTHDNINNRTKIDVINEHELNNKLKLNKTKLFSYKFETEINVFNYINDSGYKLQCGRIGYNSSFAAYIKFEENEVRVITLYDLYSNKMSNLYFSDDLQIETIVILSIIGVFVLHILGESPLEIDINSVINKVIQQAKSSLREPAAKKLTSIISKSKSISKSNNKLLTSLNNQCQSYINDSDLHLGSLVLILQRELIQRFGNDKRISMIVVDNIFLCGYNFGQGIALASNKSLFSIFCQITGGTTKNALYDEIRNNLIKSAIPKLIRSSYSAIAQFVSVITQQIIKLIVSLSTLGELGKSVSDLSIINQSLQNKIFSALGNIAVENMKKYAPASMQMIKSYSDRQYLLLNSLQDIITYYSSNITPLLLFNSVSSDECVRSVIVDCLGKFDLIGNQLLSSSDCNIRETNVLQTTINTFLSDITIMLDNDFLLKYIHRIFGEHECNILFDLSEITCMKNNEITYITQLEETSANILSVLSVSVEFAFTLNKEIKSSYNNVLKQLHKMLCTKNDCANNEIQSQINILLQSLIDGYNDELNSCLIKYENDIIENKNIIQNDKFKSDKKSNELQKVYESIFNTTAELQRIVIMVTNMNQCIQIVIQSVDNNSTKTNKLNGLLNQDNLYNLQLSWLRNNRTNNKHLPTLSLISDATKSFGKDNIEPQFNEKMILINEIKNEINDKPNNVCKPKYNTLSKERDDPLNDFNNIVNKWQHMENQIDETYNKNELLQKQLKTFEYYINYINDCIAYNVKTLNNKIINNLNKELDINEYLLLKLNILIKDNTEQSHFHNREGVLCLFGCILNGLFVDICNKIQLFEPIPISYIDNIRSDINSVIIRSDINSVIKQAIFDLKLNCNCIKFTKLELSLIYQDVIQCVIESNVCYGNLHIIKTFKNKLIEDVTDNSNIDVNAYDILRHYIHCNEKYNYSSLYNNTQNVYTQLIGINDYASQFSIKNETKILINDINTLLQLKMALKCMEMNEDLVTIRSNDSLQILVIILLICTNKWWKYWLFIMLFILHLLHKQSKLLSSKIITVFVILLCGTYEYCQCLFRKLLNVSNKIGEYSDNIVINVNTIPKVLGTIKRVAFVSLSAGYESVTERAILKLCDYYSFEDEIIDLNDAIRTTILDNNEIKVICLVNIALELLSNLKQILNTQNSLSNSIVFESFEVALILRNVCKEKDMIKLCNVIMFGISNDCLFL